MGIEENPNNQEEIILHTVVSPVQDLTQKPSSEWTEVKSFKKIKTISHQNHQQINSEKKKTKKKSKGEVEKKPDNAKVTILDDNVNVKERSLEDIKELFFEEKTVQIIE